VFAARGSGVGEGVVVGVGVGVAVGVGVTLAVGRGADAVGSAGRSIHIASTIAARRTIATVIHRIVRRAVVDFGVEL